jgi:hypothetical protein
MEVGSRVVWRMVSRIQLRIQELIVHFEPRRGDSFIEKDYYLTTKTPKG